MLKLISDGGEVVRKRLITVLTTLSNSGDDAKRYRTWVKISRGRRRKISRKVAPLFGLILKATWYNAEASRWVFEKVIAGGAPSEENTVALVVHLDGLAFQFIYHSFAVNGRKKLHNLM